MDQHGLPASQRRRRRRRRADPGGRPAPACFACYFPATPGAACPSPTANSAASLARLSPIFGGTGEAARTTEYRINREGIVSTLDLTFGNHDIEVGGWYERQASSARRRWYAVTSSPPSTPYTRPDQYEAR